MKPIIQKCYPILAISAVAGLSMLLFRIWITGMPYYIFLAWNLFLAWIPLMISQHISSFSIKKRSGILKDVLLAGCWLLFLPNAPYILTDLFHLHNRAIIPLWYDLVLVLIFAWTGLMMGLLSLYIVHDKLEKQVSKFMANVLVTMAIALAGFGIYLGRFLRWNSWDILANPDELLYDIAQLIVHPLQDLRPLGVTLSFTTLFFICYRTFYVLINLKEYETGKK